MPDNPFYQTEKYKKYKKKQIFFQQNDGIPTYLKHGYPHMYIYWVIGVLFVISGYGAFKQVICEYFGVSLWPFLLFGKAGPRLDQTAQFASCAELESNRSSSIFRVSS